MFRVRKPLISLVGSALLVSAAAFTMSVARASGPGSDHDDDVADLADDISDSVDDHGSSGGPDLDSVDDHLDSGSSGGPDDSIDDRSDDDHGSSGGPDDSIDDSSDDDHGSSGGSDHDSTDDHSDDDRTTSGGSDHDDSDHGSSGGSDHEDSVSGSSGGSGDDGDRDSSGSSEGGSGSDISGNSAELDGSNSGSNSGSSGGSGGDDSISGSNSGSSGGSGDDGGSNSGSNSGSSGGSGDDGGSNSGSNSGSSGGSGDDGGSNSGSGSSGSNSGSGSSGSNSGSGSSGAAATATASAGDALPASLIRVETDEHGDERISGEVIMIGAEADIVTAQNTGYRVISQHPIDSMNGAIARLATPDGVSIEAATALLSALAPNAVVTSNNVYRTSQGMVSPSTGHAGGSARVLNGTMGIIDTGVDASGLSSSLVMQRAFASAHPVAREHGEIVANLAVEHGMRVYVADVFAATNDGGFAASADAIAAAIDWMINAGVPVINISIEGPNNAALAALVQRASQRGHVIVAAAGNGGPMARPAFPAAFNGSVAVTAIDANGRPYMRANRGDYIAFAAEGVNLSVRASDGEVVVSGTSFASPVIAAHIAARLQAPSPTDARTAIAALQHEVVDLGAPGKDPVFGWGALREH